MSDYEMAAALRAIYGRLSELEADRDAQDRRLNNLFREARVTKVHAAEGMAEVEADGLPSTKIPWLARSGTQREWDPPAEGERVVLLSPNGEPGRGMILPGGFSDQFKQPHDKAGEYRRTVGEKSSDTITGDGRTITGETVTIDAGKIVLKGKVYLGSADASRQVVFKGSKDSDGDTNDEAADGVFV